MEGAANIVSTIEPITTALTSSITPAQVVAILASVLGVGMGFVLMWFGVRKAISIFKKAVMRGKISA